MIEVHDPVRLMIIVEHFPEVVLNTIQKDAAVYEWFINEWVNLVAIHPETKELFLFSEGSFSQYRPLQQRVEQVDLTPILETHAENLPVYELA
jgi:uncharacterized protein